MYKKFVQTINDMWGLIGKRSTLLAVSGGMDSMCMAGLFASADVCDTIAVAHCNFNLRGDESDGDEALVRAWAEAHGVQCHVMSFDTEGFASAHGVSIEMAARELRYRWFAQLCADQGYEAVAVAHNANDNAETLMLNLVRGAGVNGLSGMSAVSGLPYAEDQNVSLIRPLLGFSRKQIEGYVFANKLSYREDRTNALSDYKRNRIRNEVFPVLGKLNPSVVATFNREMGYFSEAGEIVDDWCRAQVKDVVSVLAHCEKVSCPEIRISYAALKERKHWRYLLYHILEPYGFNSAVLASLEDLLSSDRTVSGKSFLSKDYIVLTERDALHVVARSKMAGHSGSDLTSVIPDSIGNLTMSVRTAGTYHFNGQAVKVEVLERTSDMPLKQPQGTLLFDAAKLKFPFVIRKWRNGDWLIPFGMKGKKKVSDLFTDLKYDVLMKESSVMIVDVQTEGLAEAQHIAGVAGVRSDNMYRITADTTSVVRISLSQDSTEL